MPRRLTTVAAVCIAAALPGAVAASDSQPAGASGDQVVRLVVAPVSGIAVHRDGSLGPAANVPVEVTRDRVNGVETITVIPAPDAVPAN